ncbi:MAG: DASH family cryptochrome [Halioglobus sp.]
MTALFWFRNDLRIDDNIGLTAMAGGRRLLCVYCWPRSVPWCNVTGMGAQRRRFLLESLACLQRSLRERGQELLVLHEAPEVALPRLAQRYGISRAAVAAGPGVFEIRELAQVRAGLPVPLEVFPGNTLFEPPRLPWGEGRLPAHYTPFREAIGARVPPDPLPAPTLPPPPAGLGAPAVDTGDTLPHPAFIARGGALAAARRLQAWMFREAAVASYRDTRDALQGQYASSALSPWLANGALSVRTVAQELRRYEEEYGACESTDWFYRELLWREFFYYRAYVDGARLFRTSPTAACNSCTFDPRAFARWCAGDTDYPLVNALMHQLVATGWMSNRGRQIAASCLVNELRLDWRFGAAFFEKHLLDYDVASNYGNWAYIAGAGADPRGGRHFDIHKQTQRYDPEGEFIACWQGVTAPQPRYVVDAADWPIGPDDAAS